jgi:hypothetical protein
MRQPTQFAATSSTYPALFVENQWIANFSYAVNVTVFHINHVLIAKLEPLNMVDAKTLITSHVVTCNRPWMPFTVGCSGKYQNLSTIILEHFRYPLAVISAPAGPNRDIHSDCKNNNDNNIHQFQSSSSVKHSNPFQPTTDLLHSAKRKLTYPSPEHGDSASPTTSLTVTRSPACPSPADIHHYPTRKRIREV